MKRARLLAAVVIVLALGLLAGCHDCASSTVQTSQVSPTKTGDRLSWHDASGDTEVKFFPQTDTTLPVAYGGGMLELLFEIPGQGPRGLAILHPDVDDGGAGTYALEDSTAWIFTIDDSGQSTGTGDTISLQGTLVVRSSNRSSLDAELEITDSGETGPRGGVDVLYVATESQQKCVNSSLF